MQSFDKQLREALPDLWRYAWSLTRDREMANDLVQDCVERALRKKTLWLPTRPLKPWLIKIMLNIFRNQYHMRRQSGRIGIDHMPEISSNCDERLDAASVLTAIEMLPEEQKEVLMAVLIGGLSYKEAASTFGIPVGTVMSRISRAREKLRLILDAPNPPRARPHLRRIQ